MRITYPALAASALLAVAVQPSMAVGFGRVVNSTVLGQSLDVAVPLSADATEQITAECVSADVSIGDNPLPAAAVQWRLDAPASGGGVQWLRIHSSVHVMEPVVSLTVSAGCASRVQRQFTVFVDPPLTAYETSVPVVAEATATPSSPTAALKAAHTGVAMVTPAEGESAARAAPAATSPRQAASKPQRRRARMAPRAAKAETQPARSAARSARQIAKAAPRAHASTPRLQLERSAAAPAMAAMASAPVAAEMAASAAAMVAAAASAASEAERVNAAQREQIAELQRRLEQSALETQVSHAKAAQLQARLEAAEAARYSLPWLVALTAVVAVSLFGLGVLLDRWLARRPRRPSWAAERPSTRFAPSSLKSQPLSPVLASQSPSTPPDDDPRDALTSTGPLLFNRMPSPAPLAESAGADVPVLAPAAVEVAAVSDPRAQKESVRAVLPVTADALIDLQQQAEFFVALGQEETALDLLDGFTRGAGGACPMPYLMLLDMHRRRGDASAYAGVRERYGRRFHRAAPAWDEPPAAATSIADHLEEMQRIEMVWGDPPAAMRLVESLMVHGGTPAVAFDLHCLGELQFLYLMARDRSDVSAQVVEPVDLLLPLSTPSASASASAHASAVDLELDFLPPLQSASK